MDLKLKGKTAFISGSTQGIGYAIAQELLKEGVLVTINGREPEKTRNAREKLLEEFPSAKIQAIAADFSKKEQVAQILPDLSDIDILINNVGIFETRSFEEITDEDWYRFFEVNVMSSVRLCKKLLPNMLAKKWGRIIFISSESGVNVPENMIHYGMTKSAISAISNGLSKLTKETQVTVNTILGGPTYTDGVAKVIRQIAKTQNSTIEKMKADIIQQTNPHILLQRFIKPSEIATLATYLASPLALATNGASIRADSGVLQVI
ncbi:SDR family oxidoreductase [Galbibacter sp.]|uniref:SDR family NAD(P)-dependent oxidoreductase n=1 Tax=Galbibacter sp. TaxID=2918471 RepID=UPI002CFE1E44|nr:SDR family oxidoreductase [Galbibacter sp.]HLV63468.1 SDR family oxidoreductase [Galbibacter sp.]